MEIFPYVLLGFYCLTLIYITVYCLLQIHLLVFYRRFHKHEQEEITDMPLDQELPLVTIQLPIFNEQYVVQRLIDNITKLDYPKDRMEIQVLDDSTDDTLEISRQKVEEYQAKGFDIQLLHRTDRTGYKAGALKSAMKSAKGEFIAIFDADFLPRQDFLRKCLPFFQNKEVGVVQARWEHINQNYSLLTRLQAMQLDVHFRVEQKGRYAGNCLLQFNGTAGIWRRATIDDAGGWEADTLTEDLDLSYRAQLKGWRIEYLENLTAPAELPAEMNGLKSQQFRWTKGGAETAKKMLPTIWKANIPLRQKIHGTVHLMGSSIFVSVLLTAILSVPLLMVIDKIDINLNYALVFYSGMIAVISVYYVANVEMKDGKFVRNFLKFLFLFPMFISLSMGLSLHNTIAVLQGYLGRKSAFVRTPKFNIQGLSDTFKKNSYLNTKISWVTIFEGIFALVFAWAVYYGIFHAANQGFVIFHVMLAFGFGSIFYFSVSHLRYK
ncbi:MAG: cellulose synthase family protein [Bacteroidota bacterium]